MNGTELLYKMELIDPAYVEAADAAPLRKKRPRSRWAVLAACLCLLVGSVTAMAVSGFGTRLLEAFTLRAEPGSDLVESGFTLGVEIERIPVDALQGDIREVPAAIRKQFASYEPHMSWYPGHWQQQFDSREAACAFIGYDGLTPLPWTLNEEETLLSVYGEPTGNILSVTVETHYTEGGIRMQYFSELYTENREGDISFQSVTTEYAAFTGSYRTTAKGKLLHVIEQTPLPSGYMGLDGYLVEQGVLHRLHIAHTEQDAAKAKELLYQWADLF